MEGSIKFNDALKALCSIESIANIDVSEAEPYGKGCAEALNYMLELCNSFGFKTVNRDNKIGYAEIGSGDELVGILCHLDVVPAGSGWTYPAYDLTETGDRLYGRGVTDDKGPAMACVYAMKEILEERAPIKRRIRIIFGQSEETGDWNDMEYYKAHEELPDFGFTPDADFPAINGEKRLLCFTLRLPVEKNGILSLSGGSAPNIVADSCTVEYKAASGAGGISIKGKAAHASTPDLGKNAILRAMEILGENEKISSPLVSFFKKYVGTCVHGEKMECALEDAESGKLTMNIGKARTAHGIIEFTVDVREPVSFEDSAVIEPLTNAAAEFGISVEMTENKPPVYMDRDGEIIQKLLNVYRNATGDVAEPMVIGGGTYAKAMKNIIAYGPMLPGRELTEHMANEYILKDDMELIRKIYKNAILALAE